MEGCSLSRSKEYLSFRNAVPLKTVVVETIDENDVAWRLYDFGPREINHPVIFLPPASGTADVYFLQMLALGNQGYRVISVDFPPYWTHEEWADGFRKLLDTLKFDKVHLVGASLGGFLAQKFAELLHRQNRVLSIVLINSFSDTSVFRDTSLSGLYWTIPGFLLKRYLMSNYPQNAVEPDVADSIDFMVERLDTMKQKELASRLTLNSLESYIEPQMLSNMPVTIIDVFDECALSSRVKDDMYKLFPHAKFGHLKKGGNFPYLSRPDEVNMYLKIHLREFASDVIDMKAERSAEFHQEPTSDGAVVNGKGKKVGKVSSKAAVNATVTAPTAVASAPTRTSSAAVTSAVSAAPPASPPVTAASPAPAQATVSPDAVLEARPPKTRKPKAVTAAVTNDDL